MISAGNAMKAMTRISSITRRDIQMMTSSIEDEAKRSKSLSDMPVDLTVDIESLRNVYFLKFSGAFFVKFRSFLRHYRGGDDACNLGCNRDHICVQS